MMLGVNGLGDNISASTILEKVAATYKTMKTYKAEGTIISDIDTGGMKMNTETSFSILLKKPNLYLILWTQKNMPIPGMIQSGAVWSDGTQPYLYMGMMNTYAKMTSDELALSSATGISGGAAFTIPSLFLSLFKAQSGPFYGLKDTKIEKTEKVGEEDCYVISGATMASKKETLWISKSRHLILKHFRSFEPPEGGMTIPEMTDKDLEETIKGLGQSVTEESKKRMRAMMEGSIEMVKTMKIKGSSMEVHENISSPELDKNDFKFALPQGAILKESLFEGMFSLTNGIANKWLDGIATNVPTHQP